MNKPLTSTLLTALAALVALAGCTADTVTGPSDGRAVLLSQATLDDCDDVREICLQTYPVQCFSYCNDEPETCEPVACPAIYPTPPECESTCVDPGPIDCTTAVEFTDAEGEVLVGCVEPGEPGDDCEYACTASYPSTCSWTCPGDRSDGGGGTVGPPCAVFHGPDGEEITECYEPGEPGGTDSGCHEVCTASFPAHCYLFCPDDGGSTDPGCAVSIDEGGIETEYCPDDSGCVSSVDAEGTETEYCPPGTSEPGDPGPGGSEPPADAEPQPAPAS